MNSAKETSKYQYARKLSSNSATLFSLLNERRATYPEFVYTHKPKPKIKLKTEQEILHLGSAFVALELIALWIPKPGANSYNFTSRYIHTMPDFSLFSVYLSEEIEEKHASYTAAELDSIISNYGSSNVYNIGALMFLNVLLHGKFSVSNLIAYKNIENEDDNYYFSQNHEECFFVDYLYNDTTNYIKQFYGFTTREACSTWMHRLLTPGNKLFYEMLTVALRVASTPDSLIELIINSALGKMYKFHDFKKHVLSIKKRVMSVLYSLIGPIDSHLIDDFKRTQGPQIMTSFVSDLENFISIYAVYPDGNCFSDYVLQHASIFSDYVKYIKFEALYLGTLINLPWILPVISLEMSNGIQLSEFISMFNTSLVFIDNNWDSVTGLTELGLWYYVNSLANYFNAMLTGNVVKYTGKLFLTSLFVFAAKSGLNQLCKTILIENRFIAHAVLNQSKYTNHAFFGLVGDSVDECLEKFNNVEILSLVNEILAVNRRFGWSRVRSTTMYKESDLLSQKERTSTESRHFSKPAAESKTQVDSARSAAVYTPAHEDYSTESMTQFTSAGELGNKSVIDMQAPTKHFRRRSFFQEERKYVKSCLPRHESLTTNLHILAIQDSEDFSSTSCSVEDTFDILDFESSL